MLREPEQHGPEPGSGPAHVPLEPELPLEPEQPPLGPEQMLPGPVAQQALVLQGPAASLPAEQLVPLPGLAQGPEPALVLLQPPGRQVSHPVPR